MDEDPRVEALAKLLFEEWRSYPTTVTMMDPRARDWPDNPIVPYCCARARAYLAAADAVDPLRLGRT